MIGGRKESAYVIGKSIYQNNGAKGFYKGWSSTILRDVPFSFIYWISYERLKIFYKKLFNFNINFHNNNNNDNNNNNISSKNNDNHCNELYFFSIPRTILSNFGIIANSQQKIQNDNNNDNKNNNSNNSNKSNNNVSKKEMYEKKKIYEENNEKNSEYSIFLTFLSGSTSGVLAAILTHPFDVLKTQQQLQTSEQLIKNNIHHVSYCNNNYITNFQNIINNINNKEKKLHCTNSNHNINHYNNNYNNHINIINNNKPLEFLKILQNREIFSSHNSYSIRMSEVAVEMEIEKTPSKKNMINYMKHKMFQNSCNIIQDIKSDINNIYLKYFPIENDGIIRIYRERGIEGLYKGLNMRLLTVIPASAIMVTVYEVVKKIDL